MLYDTVCFLPLKQPIPWYCQKFYGKTTEAAENKRCGYEDDNQSGSGSLLALGARLAGGVWRELSPSAELASAWREVSLASA